MNESAYFPNFSPSLGITILFNLCKFDEKWSYFASLWLLVIIIFYHYSLEIFLVTFKQYMCFSWFISFIKGLLMSQFFYRDFYWFIFPFSDSEGSLYINDMLLCFVYHVSLIQDTYFTLYWNLDSFYSWCIMLVW